MGVVMDLADHQPDYGAFFEGPGFRHPTCQIVNLTRNALSTCTATQAALRQLRELLVTCPDCPQVEGCDMHEHSNHQVDRAVAMIMEEWGW